MNELSLITLTKNSLGLNNGWCSSPVLSAPKNSAVSLIKREI